MEFLIYALAEPLVLALLAFCLVILATRGQRAESGSPIARRIAVFGSIAVLAPFVAIRALPVVDVALRYLAPPMSLDFISGVAYRWWLLPLPVAAAVIVALVALAGLSRDKAAVEEPVFPVVPRNWLSFIRHRDVVIGAAALAFLVAVSVLAGLASATDAEGLHTLILIPGGDLGPQPIDGPLVQSGSGAGSATFYGWAYSLPVVILALVLAAVIFFSLRSIAARPFARPGSMDSETRSRRELSAALVRLGTAAILLPLGGALGMIGAAGLGSSGVGIPGVGTFMWSLGYAAFAPAIYGSGIILEAVAVVMLLAAIRGERALRWGRLEVPAGVRA